MSVVAVAALRLATLDLMAVTRLSVALVLVALVLALVSVLAALAMALAVIVALVDFGVALASAVGLSLTPPVAVAWTQGLARMGILPLGMGGAEAPPKAAA